MTIREVRELGYWWVQTAAHLHLLQCSIGCRGASWGELYAQLARPDNQRAYEHGPSLREAWIAEVAELQRARMPPHNWLADKRPSWEKLATSLQHTKVAAPTDRESMQIYAKHARLAGPRN